MHRPPRPHLDPRLRQAMMDDIQPIVQDVYAAVRRWVEGRASQEGLARHQVDLYFSKCPQASCVL